MTFGHPGGGGGGGGFAYDDVDVSADLAAGDVISQGYCPMGSSTNGSVESEVPGLGFPGYAGVAAKFLYAPLGAEQAVGTSANTYARVFGAPGTRLRIKARILPFAAARLNANFELHYFGWVYAQSVLAATVESWWGHLTEDSRDNGAQTAIAVDTAGNVKYVDCANGGDASYQDPVGGPASITPTDGFDVQMGLSIPEATVDHNDFIVDLSVGGVTVLDGANPVSVDTGNYAVPLILLNANAQILRCVYELTKL